MGVDQMGVDQMGRHPTVIYSTMSLQLLVNKLFSHCHSVTVTLVGF